ncbi:MAG: cytochrome c [Flavitalea sp.]
MKKKFLVIASCILLVFACSKKSEDTAIIPPPDNPGGGTTCDTANVKYTQVVTILSANCYTCHGTSTNAGSNGIVLEGYDNLKVKADNGALVGVITHANGFPPMPQGGAKLSDCNINKIKSWINNGKQNN